MVQLQAAALAGNEPQAAPLPGVLPWRCLWPWQKCRLFWFCPACYKASFQAPFLTHRITEVAEASLSVESVYEPGQELGEER